MAEFDEKLNSLLSDPNAMAQIMQLAQSLSGGQEPAPPPPPKPSPSQPADFFSSLAGSADQQLLLRLLPLVQELGSQSSNNARNLLLALRPYLKEERQQKVERALQLAKLFHIGKRFLATWEE